MIMTPQIRKIGHPYELKVINQVFIRLNAAAFIKFFVIPVRCLFKIQFFFLERKLNERALKYTHFEPKNIVLNEGKFPKLDWAKLPFIGLVFWLYSFELWMYWSDLKHWGPFVFYEVEGAGGICWSPITNYHGPPPLSPHFFSRPPPTDGDFWDDSPFQKRHYHNETWHAYILQCTIWFVFSVQCKAVDNSFYRCSSHFC